jgi:hypothetical protein
MVYVLRCQTIQQDLARHAVLAAGGALQLLQGVLESLAPLWALSVALSYRVQSLQATLERANILLDVAPVAEM